MQSENAITSGSGSAGVAGSVINNKYRNSFHCLYLVLKEEGIRGLYKGLSASILGLSESTLQFVTYEALKKSFKESRIKSAADDPIKLMDAQQSCKKINWEGRRVNVIESLSPTFNYM